MLTAKIWTGPTAVGEATERLRRMFGHINVLKGTEHAYVLNYGGDRDALRLDIQTAVRWLKPGDIRIANQTHRMRASLDDWREDGRPAAKTTWRATHVVVDEDGDERNEVMLVDGLYAVTEEAWNEGGRWETAAMLAEGGYLLRSL